MPIYEYNCNDCKSAFEFMQKITEEPKKECPKCKGSLKKLLSQSSFILKGTGWYKTDYKDKLNKKVASTSGNPIADMDTNVQTDESTQNNKQKN